MALTLQGRERVEVRREERREDLTSSLHTALVNESMVLEMRCLTGLAWTGPVSDQAGLRDAFVGVLKVSSSEGQDRGDQGEGHWHWETMASVS